MLLKNYFSYDALLFGKTNGEITDLTGQKSTSSSLLNLKQKCLVGSGNRAAKVDDYALEAEIEGMNTTFNVNVSDSGTKIVNTISNLTNDTVTISEVGIACYPNQMVGYLMTRTVLDEPVVLEPGDVVAIETQFA